MTQIILIGIFLSQTTYHPLFNFERLRFVFTLDNFYNLEYE